MAEVGQPRLPLGAFAAGLGETAGKGDAGADAGRDGVGDRIDQGFRRDGEDGEVRGFGQGVEIGAGGDAMHRLARAVDRHDPAGKGKFQQSPHGFTAEVAGTLRGADHDHGSRFEYSGKVREPALDRLQHDVPSLDAGCGRRADRGWAYGAR